MNMLDRRHLAHKVALVTGVSRRQGIGAAIALELARSGADVCTAYYRPYDREMPWGVEESEPDDILDELRTTGVTAYGVEIDLGIPEGPRKKLLKDLLYFCLVAASVPPTLVEAACRAGSTIMVEARKKK